jgi:hypothetical protein
LDAPQPVPLPDRSLAGWTSRIKEICETSSGCEDAPTSLSLSPRPFRAIDNDETLYDIASPFSEGFPEEMADMAEAEDAKQKKSILVKIEEQVPAV